MKSGVEEPGVLVEFLVLSKAQKRERLIGNLILLGNRFLSDPKIGGSKADAGLNSYLRRLKIHPPLLVLFSNSLASVATLHQKLLYIRKT